MRFSIAGRAIVGSRSYQEDTWRVSDAAGVDHSAGAGANGGVAIEGDALVLVADGIGGLSGGAVASDLVAETFTRAFFEAEPQPQPPMRHDGPALDAPTAQRMDDAVDAANHALAAKLAEQAQPRAMGSTLIAALLGDTTMTFVSVGDSLLLRLRDDEYHRVNEDHSNHIDLDLAALDSDTPETWEAALLDHQRMAITSALMGRSLKLKQIATRSIQPGDIVILASDGLETLDTSQIRAFVRHLQPKGVGAIADGLLKAISAISKGRSQDNTTIVVVEAFKSAGPRSTDDLSTEIRPAPAESRKDPAAKVEPASEKASAAIAAEPDARAHADPAEAPANVRPAIGQPFVRPNLAVTEPAARTGIDLRQVLLALVAVVALGAGLWIAGMLDFARYFTRQAPAPGPAQSTPGYPAPAPAR